MRRLAPILVAAGLLLSLPGAVAAAGGPDALTGMCLQGGGLAAADPQTGRAPAVFFDGGTKVVGPLGHSPLFNRAGACAVTPR